MKQWLLNRIPLLVACVLLLACLTACGACITWMDADGMVLETYVPEEGQEIPDRPLPPDDDEWHYTGWKVQTRGKSASYTAERVAKIPGLSCLEPDGAFYIFMNIKPLLGRTIQGVQINSSAEFAQVLLEKGLVAVVPGEAFRAPGYLRWSYATSMENIREGLDRLEKFLAE